MLQLSILMQFIQLCKGGGVLLFFVSPGPQFCLIIPTNKNSLVLELNKYPSRWEALVGHVSARPLVNVLCEGGGYE